MDEEEDKEADGQYEPIPALDNYLELLLVLRIKDTGRESENGIIPDQYCLCIDEDDVRYNQQWKCQPSFAVLETNPCAKIAYKDDEDIPAAIAYRCPTGECEKCV